jgi:20S proteasome alpha/beta subunit
VTIAAGFRMPDAIVLCADTQETATSFKYSVAKIDVVETKNCTMAIAGSGQVAFIDKVIERILNAVSNAGKMKLDIARAIEDSCVATYDQFWKLYPPDNLIEVDLIIGLSTQDDIGLYVANGPLVNKVDRFKTIGCGGELSRYIIDRMLSSQMPLGEAIVLALYTLMQAKSYAVNCGGDSHLVVLSAGNRCSRLGRLHIDKTEKKLKELDDKSRNHLLFGLDSSLSDEDFVILEKRLGSKVDLERVRSGFSSRKDWELMTKALEEEIGKVPD